MNKAKVLTILFRDFIVYNFIFTLAGGYYLWFFGAYSYPFLFWIKVAGYVLLGIWYYQSRRHRLYFYYNLGLSNSKLISYVLLIDGFITLLFFLLIYGLT
ncbi:MAG: hypothetical protein CMP48_04540 [Rickettsiales bacterium]|nr:hypothetical protein [Rickettsiales bacterium]